MTAAVRGPARGVRSRTLLAGAIGCGLLVWLLGSLSRRTALGVWLDTRAVGGFTLLEEPSRRAELASAAAHLTDPLPFALLAAALLVVGVARGRAAPIVATAGLVTGAVVTAHALRRLWAPGSSDGLGAMLEPSTFPSVHATAAMALAVGAVLVGPHAARGYLAVAVGGLTFGQVIGVLSQAWSLPSDVLAGYLVVAGWASVVLALLLVAARRRARAADGSVAPALRRLAWPAVAVALVAAVGLVAAFGLSDAASFARRHSVGAAAAGLLALTSVALPVGVAAVLPGPPRRAR